MKRVFVDANIVIDLLCERYPWSPRCCASSVWAILGRLTSSVPLCRWVLQVTSWKPASWVLRTSSTALPCSARCVHLPPSISRWLKVPSLLVSPILRMLSHPHVLPQVPPLHYPRHHFEVGTIERERHIGIYPERESPHRHRPWRADRHPEWQAQPLDGSRRGNGDSGEWNVVYRLVRHVEWHQITNEINRSRSSDNTQRR